jgi:ABC-type polar amino acid transport system ATPase subunit
MIEFRSVKKTGFPDGTVVAVEDFPSPVLLAQDDGPGRVVRSGKTTLLRMINRKVDLSSGNVIEIDGEAHLARHSSPAALHRLCHGEVLACRCTSQWLDNVATCSGNAQPGTQETARQDALRLLDTAVGL